MVTALMVLEIQSKNNYRMQTTNYRLQTTYMTKVKPLFLFKSGGKKQISEYDIKTMINTFMYLGKFT
jgi:hypothetical protein